MINLVNKHKHKETPQDIYIGRGSALGNPWDWRGSLHAKYQCKNRQEAIANYEKWLDDMIKRKDFIVCSELNRIFKLYKQHKNINLVCFCDFPDEDCHGRIVKERLESKITLTKEPKKVK